MEYISPLKKGGGRGTVHAILDEKVTWCNWEYMTSGSLNGRAVPRAVSDPGPLTCRRCAHRMMALVTYRMSKVLDPAQMADLMEHSTRIVMNERDPR